MQTGAGEAPNATNPATAGDNPDAILASAEAVRPREELTVLYAGFGLALLIGGFFLIYVVIAIAHIGAFGGS
jgi:hypothetical protein